jgi:putative FmdB family regulatory protein
MLYEHICKSCNKEFEKEYGMTESVPTKCDLCGVEGFVERLISGFGKHKGRVELHGQELKDQLKKEAAEFKRELIRNPDQLANFIGNEKYEANVVAEEKYLKERPRIQSRRKSDRY